MASKYAGIVQDELRDLRGNAMQGAVVIVREVGTTTPATVYNNPVLIAEAAGGDALVNDGTTGLPAASGLLQPGLDANGNYTFYADADVSYDLRVLWNGLTFDYRVRPKVVDEAYTSTADLTAALAGTYVPSGLLAPLGGTGTLTEDVVVPSDGSTFSLPLVALIDPLTDIAGVHTVVNADDVPGASGAVLSAGFTPTLGPTFNVVTGSPTIVRDALGTRSAIACTDTSAIAQTAAAGVAEPHTVAVVGKYTATATNRRLWGDASGTNIGVYIDGSSQFRLGGTTGSLTDGAADTNWHLFVASWAGSGTDTLRKDKAQVAGGSLVATALTGLTLTASAGGGNNAAAQIAWIGRFDAALTADTIAELELWASHHFRELFDTPIPTADLGSSGFVRFNDLVIRYSGKTETALTGCTVLSGTGQTLPSGAVLTQVELDSGAVWLTGDQRSIGTKDFEVVQTEFGPADVTHAAYGGVDLTGVASSAAAIRRANGASAHKRLPLAGSYRIDEDLTLTGTWEFASGAVLSVDSGKTVSFAASAVVRADDRQIVFDGAGTVKVLTDGEVAANWWGPVASTDIVVRFNRATRNTPNARKYVYTSDGTEWQTALDLTDAGRDAAGNWRRAAHEFIGRFSWNVASGTQCLVDGTGVRFLKLKTLQLAMKAGSASSKTGILHARLSTGDTISDGIFEGCSVTGDFTVAAFMAVGAEVARHEDFDYSSSWDSAVDLGTGLLIAGINDYGVTSPYKAIWGATAISNTVHEVHGGRLIGWGLGGSMYVRGADRLSMDGVYMQATDNALAYMTCESGTGLAVGACDLHIYGEGDGEPSATSPLYALLVKGSSCLQKSRVRISTTGVSYTSRAVEVTSSGDPFMDSELLAPGHAVRFNVASAWSLKPVSIDAKSVTVNTTTAPTIVRGNFRVDTPAELVGVGANGLRLRTSSTADTASQWFSLNGSRLWWGPWIQDNVPANQAATPMARDGGSRTALAIPKAGAIVGVSIRSNEARTAGSMEAYLTINGAQQALLARLDAGNTVAMVRTGYLVVAAGDVVGVNLLSSAGWAPVTADIDAMVEVLQ